MDQSLICPRFEKAITLLSKRWTGLIIYQLLNGPQRFCTVESSIGISGKVLSDRLKDLENEGIVKREVIPETPVRIEYSLTEKGLAMEPLMKEIEKWSQEWLEA
ncbi:winged helix-turn-helix transcriptional regulator [Bacillus thermotolerans]|uniref:Transcriptional regulator, HxlR family n=1 Tax=Bacillus thermotolerans TaxID=1221996 RepID=A0A0F5HI32_BACTR|nr:helix-turn-helix domain-containing protein [Bacillus thermotolerans]KKB33029.1 Transcriptional regulator, HxlR family [Bacillus thermotolerans]KKB33648.1 Transcriptional regulator, HxlR family [Bacillus thermotolerans]KKB35588.1 Transcriptional regulator, HxlR family [Bacillus thermotolerans]